MQAIALELLETALSYLDEADLSVAAAHVATAVEIIRQLVEDDKTTLATGSQTSSDC